MCERAIEEGRGERARFDDRVTCGMDGCGGVARTDGGKEARHTTISMGTIRRSEGKGGARGEKYRMNNDNRRLMQETNRGVSESERGRAGFIPFDYQSGNCDGRKTSAIVACQHAGAIVFPPNNS